MLYIFLVLFVACNIPVFCSQDLVESTSFVDFTVQIDRDDYRQLLIEALPEAFMIRTINYVVDGMYSTLDFVALTGWQEGQVNSRVQVLNGLFYVKQTGLFSAIDLHIHQVEQGVYDFKVSLRQSILLENIRVTGFLRNKQLLKNIYVMDPGDVFDREKHEYSIEQMKLSLQEQGYLQAQIHDLILPENSAKAVVVRCGVVAGPKFKVGRVTTKVECIGNLDFVDLQQLSSYIGDFFSRKLERKYYTASLLSSARSKVRLMLQHQGFVDVEIQETVDVADDEHVVNLTIVVKLEKKRELVVWGNSFLKRDQILESLLLYGKSTWHFPSSIIRDEISQLYKNKGFWDVVVSVREERQRLFCFVQEGVRSSISNVSLLNVNYSQGHIFSQRCFKSCLKSRYYDKETLKKSLDSLLKSYKAAGFWDIKLLREEFVVGKKPHSYEYVITLDEGVRRLMGTFSVQHSSNVESVFLQTWDHCRGKGFDGNLLVEQRQWLMRYFKGKGYQNVVVEHELLDHDGIVDVVWHVKLPESIMKFGKTIILGSTKVPYYKLQKELAYKEGDDWDKSLLEKTLQNLKEIPVFESAQIYPGRDKDEFGYKPLFVKLIEEDKYEIKSRFGLQQVGRNLQPRRGFTYKIGASLGVNRFFSVVDKLTLYADITRFYRDLGMTYDVPWLYDKRVRCQLKIYDALYQQPVYIGSQDSLYKAGQQGFLWNMLRKFDRLTLSGSVGVEYLSLYQEDQPDLDLIIRYDKKLLGKRTGYAFIEPTVMWRQLDNELNPTRGFVSFLSCRGMFDFQYKTTFCKLLAEHTQYIPIVDSMVLAIRGRAGHVFNRCFEQIHPIERFYLGGASSVRGYERDYCPPLGRLTKPIYDQHAGLPPQAENVWRYAPQGGRTMFNLNAELRCGVYKNFGVVAFSDLGALFQNSMQEARHAWCCNTFAGSGLGIRYETPIGSLRFDVGVKWKIQYKDFEAPYVVYLSLGQAF